MEVNSDLGKDDKNECAGDKETAYNGRERQVRNINGKLVCNINEKRRTVEIVHKKAKTVVCFKSDGYVEVINE